MKQIESCLNALQAGAHKEEIVLETLNSLEKCNVPQLSENRIIIARTFYQLLCYCQVLYDGILPEEIIEKLIIVFESVRRISIDATEEEKRDSSMITVWFLNELEARKEDGDMQSIDDELLRDTVEILLEGLDDIHFIFEIKKEGKLIFPINKMIAKVVAKPEFIGTDKPLSTYHIHILQLAVKLFRNNDDEKQILDNLRDSCNLKFLDYLKNPKNIIDTKDLLNNSLNGVMIFCDLQTLKILIRHEREEYFANKPEWMLQDIIIEYEWDYHKNNKIGVFIEYDLSIDDSLIDFSEMLITEEGRCEFLKLIYDMHAYNILLEKSIVKKADGSYFPINPYCYQDKKIVKGKLQGKEGKAFELTQLKFAINEYRNTPLKTSNQYVMNRVPFGLGLELLQNGNGSVDMLGMHDFIEDDWYQNQMLKSWVLNSSNPLKALEYVLKMWCRELEYCNHRKKLSKGSRVKNIEEHIVSPQDLYPLNCDITWIYQMLDCIPREEWYVFSGTTFEENEDIFLNVELYGSSMGAKYREITGEKSLSVSICSVEDLEGIYEDEWGTGQSYFFMYRPLTGEAKFVNQEVLKLIFAIEELQRKNAVTFDVAKRISKSTYNEVQALMELHKLALTEAGMNAFPEKDFASQVYYRLIHNMVWSEISEDKVDDYFKIILHHQKLSFEEVDKNCYFSREDESCLYVPKDCRYKDSVLVSIYDNYMKTHFVRDKRDLFNTTIQLKNDEYHCNGKRINKIIFLCDNFESGKATKKMLAAYLDLHTEEFKDEIIDKVKLGIQKYYILQDIEVEDHSISEMDNQRVSLKEIIEQNKCKVSVYGYFGTELGKRAIDEFLTMNDIEFEPTDYEIEITSKATQIEIEVKRIWPQIECWEFYTVVREFNMTKANVFPNEMLNDARKSICLFVKKQEILL